MQSKKNSKTKQTHQSKFTSPLIDSSALKLDIQKEFLRFVFCFIGALFIYLTVALLIVKFFHPDLQSLIDKGLEVSIVTDFQPEPVEALLYRIGLILLPLSLLLFYWISHRPAFDRLFSKKWLAYSLCAIIFSFIIYIGYYLFAQPNPTSIEILGRVLNEHDRVTSTNFLFFFTNLFLQNHIWLYTLLIVPLILLFYLFVVKNLKKKILKGYNIIISCTGYSMVLFILVALFKMNHFDLPVNWQNQYDFNAIYYSMTQVNAGSQMLVDNFTNTYGLYPHFLLPIFKIFGLSASNFTLVMSILIVFCFLSIFFFLHTFSKDRLLIFLGFASIVLLPYFQIRFVTDPDSVFAFFPIRMLCPSILLLNISLLYLSQKSSKKIAYNFVYYVSMLILPFGMLWNLEFGAVSFIAWILFLLYFDFYNKEGKINWKILIKHCAIGLFAVIFAFGLYAVIQYAQYGNYPHYRLLFSTLAMFSGYGFFMLPMPLWHPWIIIGLVYIVGLLYGIAKFVRKQISFKSAVIFLVSILGCGLFAYYQGRSHNLNLAAPIIFFFINLVLLTDELWTSYKRTSSIILIPFLYLSLFCLVFSTIDIINNTDKISNLANQKFEKREQKLSAKAEKNKILANQLFIDSCKISSNKILLFTSHKYQGLYMQNPSMRSAVNPGLLDMFYKTDVQRYINTITDSTDNIFLDIESFYYTNCEAIRAAITQHYDAIKWKKDTTQINFAFLEKDKERLPQNVFLNRTEKPLYHEKFYDDSIGNANRIDLASNGIDSLELPVTMTMEIVFNPDSFQMYRAATVIGNFTDTSGLGLIQNGSVEHPENYSFIMNGRAFSFSITPAKWHYLVIIINTSMVRVIDNGNEIAAVIFPESYIQPTNNLFIGNLDTRRNFFGLISEIAITNKIIPDAQIKSTYQQIKKELKLQ